VDWHEASIRIVEIRFSVPELHGTCRRPLDADGPRNAPTQIDFTLGSLPHRPLTPLNFSMPGASTDLQTTSQASSEPEAASPNIQSALLHRTPWTPPTAVRASGINIELEDGRQLIDAVGGAAVACLGMGNKKVMDAITNQLRDLTCEFNHVFILSRPDKK
jgi:hypothetical protein